MISNSPKSKKKVIKICIFFIIPWQHNPPAGLLSPLRIETFQIFADSSQPNMKIIQNIHHNSYNNDDANDDDDDDDNDGNNDDNNNYNHCDNSIINNHNKNNSNCYSNNNCHYL